MKGFTIDMLENRPLLSLIIPVYNVSQYLKRCLDSCLDQEFDDYEIICIDDGSTDDSGEILDRYSNQYHDIVKVLHIENRGVSQARNLGIKVSTGNYLWFIDPDDFIKNNIIGDITSKLTGLDILLLPFEKIKEGHIANKNDIYMGSIHSTFRFKEYISLHQFDKVWNYVVAKKVLTDNNLMFGEGIVLAEDYAFDFFLKEHISNWDIYNKIAYYYCIRSNSASKGHPSNDETTKRIIDNSFWTAVYFRKNVIKYDDLALIEQAQRIQYDHVRSSINNSIKLGDLMHMKKNMKRLIEYNLYPYPVKLSTQNNCMINNIASNLFNSQIIAEAACVIWGLKKRFLH